MYKGPETKDFIRHFIQPVVEKLKAMMMEPSWGNKKLYLNPDLAGLGKMTNLKHGGMCCPFCQALTVCSLIPLLMLFREWFIIFLIFFEPCNLLINWDLNLCLTICILHTKMRVLSNIMISQIATLRIEVVLTRKVQKDFIEILQSQVRSLPGCSQFTIR